MARNIDRLNARTVKTLGPGLHADGGGLYLRVEAAGARRWVFIVRRKDKRSEMGLGPLSDISLARARELAQEARGVAREGKDPIAERRRARAALQAVSFGELADQLVDDLESQWKNPKVPQQWRNTLKVDAASLRPKLVSQITTEDVLAVLKPIWTVKPVTASRLRGRIERVLDAAKATGKREGENPARWRGHLSLLLPRGRREKRHHAALPYDQIRSFCSKLRSLRLHGARSISTLALYFTILTAARSSEVLFAAGREIDQRQAIWTIPAERMKSGREHRVPLSASALAIAKDRIKIVGDGYLFPGLARDLQTGERKPLSNMAMSKVLDLMGYGDYTVHGFRSTFRDWGGDRTAFAREIVEAALAHIVGDEAEQAYRRSDALERRRKLMDAWAEYCAARGQVVQLIA